MSASLVGSEMCIRDRVLRWSEGTTSQPPIRSPPIRDPRNSWLLAHEKPCLLYTSDAADDM
eukprot:14906623-Alexandrium_andersonii.AAC.1